MRLYVYLWQLYCLLISPWVCYAENSVNFLLLGDWGLSGANQTLIANQMGMWADQHKASFVVALGDNFYYNGVNSETDNQWLESYQNVFTAPSLQIPWYAILGNHDYYGDPEAQIRYFKNRRDNRWTMPDHNYTYIYNLPTATGGVPATLQIVFIDTALISVEENAVTREGGKSYISPERSARYLAVVESMLASSTATWLIVAGHYTIFSYADHGNNSELIEKLVPLLQKYKVHAYFNGHDHVLQHIVHHSISYVTVGRGAMRDNFPDGSFAARLTNESYTAEAAFKYGVNGPGFCAMTATPESLHMQFIDRMGNNLYDTTFVNPHTGTTDSKLVTKNQGQSLVNGMEITGSSYGWLYFVYLIIGVVVLALLVYVPSVRRIVKHNPYDNVFTDKKSSHASTV